MDYFEILKKIENIDQIAKENEELKKKVAELEQGTPTNITIESDVVKAFKDSDIYRNLEVTFFVSFLQEKFLNDFQRSPHAKGLMEQAQAAFKKFEKEYGKKKPAPMLAPQPQIPEEEKSNGQSNQRAKAKVSNADGK